MNKVKYFAKEISYVKNDSKRRDLEYLINLLPDYFFLVPVSIGDECHPRYANTKSGLVKHTKVAVRLAYDMFETVNNFSDNDKDLIIMALILHDGLKKGMVEEKYTRCDHPLLVSKLIMENVSNLEMDIDDVRKMCMLIESHMGTCKYNDVELPVPNTEMQRYVHRCNFLANKIYLNVSFSKLDIL